MGYGLGVESVFAYLHIKSILYPISASPLPIPSLLTFLLLLLVFNGR